MDDESSMGQLAAKQAQIKLKDMEAETQSLANSLGLNYVNLFGFPISPEALALIKEEEAKRLNTICFYFDGEHLRLATITPDDPEVTNLLAVLSEQFHCQGAIYFVSEHSFDSAMKLYKTLPKTRKFITGVEITPEDFERMQASIQDYRQLAEKINEVNISDVITLILATSVKTGSSDIHIEAEERGIIVRYRIDGVLQEAAVIEKAKWPKIISRLKLLSKVKINITDKPQDGRFTIYLPDDKTEVRVSFLPTTWGESVVMRLLRSSAVSLSFEQLGLHPKVFSILEREIKKPNGMVLATGPTGSGKTTTLYAILNKLNNTETMIATLEDPVEYKLPGINQSQIDHSKHYTFADGLRSLMRQDPDVIMVGEVRDLETAEISIQASLTGHQVLSTLHTNDASGVIPRLIEMGVKPFLLSPSINCVIGQRLIRKLCDKCKVEHVLAEDEKNQLKRILAVVPSKSGISVPAELPKIYKAGTGCDVCHGLGYKGRIGIYEILTMDNSIKEMTLNQSPAFKIMEQAIENGMITMLQDGVLKALDGITSLDEVYRVIGKFDYIDALYDMVVSKTMGRGLNISFAEIEQAIALAKDIKGFEAAISNLETAKMLNLIFATGIKAEAGDIHIDPTEDAVRIRFRIDGILHDVATISKEHYLPILGQMKILAGFATNVKKATYDGRFGLFTADGVKMDCRLSIISGGYGETIVVRLLLNQASGLRLEGLGIHGAALESIRRAIKKTKGIVITTGPTGSGKTTTLYSILNTVNNPDIKVITIEDPIEYHLEGIMQTQIDAEHGYTFATALRSLMRQNPNIIMVGEIRDPETAQTAVEAALTGHAVLSTIHANSAAGAIARFAGLGVERSLLSSAMECSIGQRLVRRLCPHCKKEVQLDADQIQEAEKIIKSISPESQVQLPSERKYYEAVGCDKCGGIGYKGRIGLYEVIEMTPSLSKLIQQSDVTDFEIEQEAMKGGTITMLQDGILKALDGETTVAEVLRVAR